MQGQVKDFCAWVEDVLSMTESKRKKLVKAVLESLRSFRSKKGLPKNHEWLSDVLERDCELVGFAANLTYVVSHERSGMSGDQLNAIMVHPLGSPTLLMKHKKLPVFMIVGPGLELDKGVIGVTG